MESSPIDDLVLALTGKDRPRVCFIPTAAGDDSAYLVRFYQRLAGRAETSHLSLFATPLPDVRERLLGQDVVYVGGGSTASMLAVWRAHGVDLVLRQAWEQGIILCGVSAGGMCWFEAGVTDSVGPALGPLTNGLALLSGSFCPHLDSEPERREVFHRLVAAGVLPGGYALDDGVALRFEGPNLAEAVSERRGASAYRLDLTEGRVVTTPIATELLEGSTPEGTVAGAHGKLAE